MNERIKTLFEKLFAYEQSAHKMALSFCFGIFVAFSPFMGLHTAMVFLFSWLFSLNFSVILAVSILIHNPWSMMPIYGIGYAFGDWFLRLFGIDHTYNPALVQSGIEWVSHHIGFSELSFWGFLLGGNVIGIVLGLICYPLVRRYAGAIEERGKATVQNTFRVARKAVAKAKPALSRITKRKKPQLEI